MKLPPTVDGRDAFLAVSRARSHPGTGRIYRTVGLLLILAGAALVMVPAAYVGYGAWQERQLTQQWREIVTKLPAPIETEPPGSGASAISAAQPTEPPAAAPPIVTRSTGIPIAFAIRVPRLNYYSAVVEGVDLTHLALGPAHYPNTPNPGHEGNVGIAAHNSYWLGFGQLRAGDRIVLETRYGTFTYRVTATRIVRPDDRTVFANNAPGNRLTLTTCWPLWAGAFADRRYVISAVEEGGVA